MLRYNSVMVTVNVQGHGSYVINTSKLNDLLTWLKQNSMPVEVNTRNVNGDDTLLNG